MHHRYLALLAACAPLLVLLLPLAASADNPPKIPHLVQGREECTTCHKAGGVGVEAAGGTGMPVDHASRQSQYCVGCHLPAAPQQTDASVQPVSAVQATTPTVVAATPTMVRTVAPTATPAATAVAPQAQALLATTSQAAGNAAALPSAGDPLEDTARIGWLLIGGLLLLLGAAALERALARS